MSNTRLLTALERYFDAAPLMAARREEIGPLCLFRPAQSAWSYYARPVLGAKRITRADVQAMRDRQRALGVPEAFEWLAEVTPSMGPAVQQAGLRVHGMPLMVLDRRRFRPAGTELSLRLADARDDLRAVSALVALGFAAAGTAVSRVGVAQLRAEAKALTDADVAPLRRLLRRGAVVTAAAFAQGLPVSAGSHNPLGPVTEVVAVATLPSFRRRGLAAAVTSRLVSDAFDRGIETICLSAGGDAVARIYERIGFRRVGTACHADPPPTNRRAVGASTTRG